MKIRVWIAAVFAVVFGCAHASADTATILPPGQQCFQATTGLNGMVGLLGSITAGSGGQTGSYGGVALTGGSGSGATANITVSGGVVTSVTILDPGTQYVAGDVLSASSGNIGGVTGFSVPVASTAINSSLAGGTVGYYIPSTLTIKQTWKDAGETILNQNPVQLDQNGCAIVYGSGSYRQILKDNLGNTVWDVLTASTGSGNSASTIPLVPQAYGAVCDGGATDSSIALQEWATALRDGGVGAANCPSGYGTSQTIKFQPSSNLFNTVGPTIIDRLVLSGRSSLVTPLLEIWNADPVSTAAFYYATFNGVTLTATSGSSAHGLSLRGYWGSIGGVYASAIGGDCVNMPDFGTGGVSDLYESWALLGEVTCLNSSGRIIGNDIGLGSSAQFTWVRGSSPSTGTGGVFLSGLEQGGSVSYVGPGWAVDIAPAGPAMATPREINLIGHGDIDCAENGMRIQSGLNIHITNIKVVVRPPGVCNAASWPLTAYSFGAATNTVVNAYLDIRAGLTAGNIGTLFDFTNTAMSNLTVNVSVNDQSNVLPTMAFSDIYKNINPIASLKIIQNGVVIYNSLVKNASQVYGVANTIAINSSSTLTQLAGTWNVKFDSNSLWDAANNRITIKTPGVYAVHGQFSVPIGAGSGQVPVGALLKGELIYFDGTTEASMGDAFITTTNNVFQTVTVSGMFNAAIGGSFYMKGTASSVSSGTLFAAGLFAPPAILEATLQTAGQ